jgi:alpha-galactosidase
LLPAKAALGPYSYSMPQFFLFFDRRVIEQLPYICYDKCIEILFSKEPAIMSHYKVNYSSGAFIGILTACLAFTFSARAAETVWLGSLDLTKVRQGYGQPHADKSVDDHPITIGGKKFEHGLGTHSISTLYIDLKGRAERFTAFVGVDDEVIGSQPEGTVVFRVVGDDHELWKSSLIKAGQAPKKIDVSLKGIKFLLLAVDKGGDGIGFDHADWADAKIEYNGEPPETVFSPPEPMVILTPKPPLQPRINSPKTFGVRPGSPFMYVIAATGQRPMSFTAENLPDGLQVDEQTGRISGAIQKNGEYIVFLSAKNDLGLDQRELKIVCGDTLALTPPMGWASGNCYGDAVDDEKIRATADAMVKTGLADHGWRYLVIDDGWHYRQTSDDPMLQGKPRDEQGNILANKKFPDMTALCNYIHDRGLKAGIYAPRTSYSSANLAKAYQQQEKDIQQFARWGFDCYKFSWMSYSRINREKGLPGLKEAYDSIQSALAKAGRDMIFCTIAASLFQDKAEDISGNTWLATTNFADTWSSVSDGFSQAGREQFARPGRWNTAGILALGVIGRDNPQPTRLTPNEQYTQISLWCLLSSPLVLCSDLTKLDEFTLNLLTNDEVLAVNQDILGKQARRVSQNENLEVWAKEMEDGSIAVGLFNRGEVEKNAVANYSELGITGKQIVRDLWLQKDIGEFENQFSAPVGRHGVVLVQMRPSGK